LLPVQDHVQAPLPETDQAMPALQRPVVGALVNCCPFNAPQPLFVTGGVTAEAAFRWTPVMADSTNIR
jgi:hypothetical protein